MLEWSLHDLDYKRKATFALLNALVSIAGDILLIIFTIVNGLDVASISTISTALGATIKTFKDLCDIIWPPKSTDKEEEKQWERLSRIEKAYHEHERDKSANRARTTGRNRDPAGASAVTAGGTTNNHTSHSSVDNRSATINNTDVEALVAAINKSNLVTALTSIGENIAILAAVQTQLPPIQISTTEQSQKPHAENVVEPPPMTPNQERISLQPNVVISPTPSQDSQPWSDSNSQPSDPRSTSTTWTQTCQTVPLTVTTEECTTPLPDGRMQTVRKVRTVYTKDPHTGKSKRLIRTRTTTRRVIKKVKEKSNVFNDKLQELLLIKPPKRINPFRRWIDINDLYVIDNQNRNLQRFRV
jgi:hypothetical protein